MGAAPSHQLESWAIDEQRREADARALALNLSGKWPLALAADDGPIDVVDMFSGAGGMSTGFRAVNAIVPAYRLAMAIDIDVDANTTYELNLGLRPKALDVGALATEKDRLKKLIASVRSSPTAPLVLIGCAPCQGFSSHRNEAGGKDQRNSLFESFATVAAIIKPDAVVIENVPEILSDRYWPMVIKARRILAEAGYHTIVAVHDMAEFGVPQNRYRAVMIGMRHEFSMPRGFLDREAYRTVRDAIGGLSPIDPGTVHSSDPMHFTASHRASTIETIKAVPTDGGNRPYDVGPDCLRRAEERRGRAIYEDVYGRLWWNRPAITITAHARNPASGRYVHPEQHRGLSVREAALLQSFPAGYHFEGAFDSRFRQIGNAVPPAFSAYLAAHLAGEIFRKGEGVEPQADIIAPVGPSFSRLIPALKAGHRQLATSIVGRRSKVSEASI